VLRKPGKELQSLIAAKVRPIEAMDRSREQTKSQALQDILPHRWAILGPKGDNHGVFSGFFSTTLNNIRIKCG